MVLLELNSGSLQPPGDLYNGINFLKTYSLTAQPLNVPLSFLVFFFSPNYIFYFFLSHLLFFTVGLQWMNNHATGSMFCLLSYIEISPLLFDVTSDKFLGHGQKAADSLPKCHSSECPLSQWLMVLFSEASWAGHPLGITLSTTVFQDSMRMAHWARLSASNCFSRPKIQSLPSAFLQTHDQVLHSDSSGQVSALVICLLLRWNTMTKETYRRKRLFCFTAPKG